MQAGISWLDVRLGARMLVKYPGLTLVGSLGMAVAIAIGAACFEVIGTLVDPALPLPGGDRVVAIQNWDAAANHPDRRSLHDFVAWREELRTVDDVGAFRTIGRNLVGADGSAEPVPIAEITASAFRLARTPPLLGRPLVEDDERPGAPPVVVIGHDVWRARFASDPASVGRTLQLGGTRYTVVGVMPEGFAFPVNHRFWIPLRADPAAYERRQGPEIEVFGRLAPGATLANARAELETVGRRTAAAFPQTHRQLRPHVLPYTHPFFDIDNAATVWMLRLVQLLVSMLLVVVCANVAILVYARTATRSGEIAVRSALGASRRRIVGQLFAEALVLSAGAAAAGLVLARVALGQVAAFVSASTTAPFWLDFGLSPGMVLYVVGLVGLAAVIVGVLPALKVTGKGMQSELRQLGGSTGMRLGKTWTVLIVAQVAFAVAVLPAAVRMGWRAVRPGISGPGFAAQEFLTAEFAMERENPPTAQAAAYRRDFAARYADRQAELARRLEAEPAVSRVTFSSRVPGEEPTGSIEFYGAAARAGGEPGHEVRFLHVDPGFFDAFGVAVLAGRAFQSGDVGAAANAVVVNRTFARQLAAGGNPLGRRLRYVEVGGDAQPGDEALLGRWFEIVGVVGDLPAYPMEPGMVEARMYHPMVPGQVYPVSVAVRVRGSDPAAFAGRLREVTTSLDPTLQLRDVLTMDEFYRQKRVVVRLTAWALGLVTLSVLLLSATGIYALMSFTVTQRRREIGIRSALGGHPRRILGSIFSRALGQLALGVGVGVAGAAGLDVLSGGALMGGEGALLLPAVSLLMMAVGLLAAVGPARRGLRIQPTEALKQG